MKMKKTCSVQNYTIKNDNAKGIAKWQISQILTPFKFIIIIFFYRFHISPSHAIWLMYCISESMKSSPTSGLTEHILNHLTQWICWGRDFGASGLLRSDTTFLTPLPRPIQLLWNEGSQQVLQHFFRNPNEALQDRGVSLAVPHCDQLASFAVSDAKF